ncbi:hypothetical protein G3M48_003121 [Beauveria asiatica]|uniref:ABC transporter domain-containing protein n=1 Tax=Beauveria asiatica TaxID=1069075 RepID=A0AAW0RW22_9HYPO
MTARSSSDPRQLQELLGINMASVFIAIWTLTGTIAIAFSFAWKLALVSFCVAVPILLGTGYWRLRYELEFDEMNNAVMPASIYLRLHRVAARGIQHRHWLPRRVALRRAERQRVSIARALVRDPDILLLDEATSALDSESEKQVQAAFERAGKGRTMLAVAHRLATVRNAHVIFVLGEGELLERGTHKELLAKRGMYWQM